MQEQMVGVQSGGRNSPREARAGTQSVTAVTDRGVQSRGRYRPGDPAVVILLAY